MLFARDELRLQGRVGVGGPALCLIMALIAVALLASEGIGQEVQSEAFDLVGALLDDSNGHALAGAFVSLTGSEWGSITNENGRFAIPDLEAGTYSITAEQLGYETLVWEGQISAAAPLQLRMAPQPMILEGLQVVTDRFQSRRNGNATSVSMYDRTALTSTSQPTVLDFVAFRVGSARERCASNARADICLRIRGRNVEPKIVVDELEILGGMDYLAAIAPHELHMVEVFGQGRHIRAYTTRFMERAAKTRLQPVAVLF
jgi:hypothetical protein